MHEVIIKEFNHWADNLIDAKEAYKQHTSIENQRVIIGQIQMLEWAKINLKRICKC
jgi:hypothetical protein